MKACEYCADSRCPGCYDEEPVEEFDEEYPTLYVEDDREPEDEPEPDYDAIEDAYLRQIHGDCP
tara:strand:+ start:710 stop:901 length:192 start_codon:yes stop_codon:yes gene_type:complete